MRERGFLARVATAVSLSLLGGLFLVFPSLSSPDTQLSAASQVVAPHTPHAPHNSHTLSSWQHLPLHDGSDGLVASRLPANIKIGSFQLQRPRGEQFVTGLGDTIYHALAAVPPSRDELELYWQGRARANLADGETASFKDFLQQRIDGSGDRLLLDSADYLNSTLNGYVTDEARRLGFIHNIEVDFSTPLGKRRGQGGLAALGALRETNDDAIVWQLRGYVAEEDSKGANAGLIYRRAAHLGTDALFGGNVFLDIEKHGESGETFLRWSLGGEYRNAYFDLTANRYFAISDPVVSGGETYYTAEGIDAELNVNLHSRASGALSGALSGGLGYYNWEGIQGDKDDEGLRYHLRFLPGGNDLQLELQFDVPEEGEEEWGGRIAYRHVLGGAKRGGGLPSGQSFDARAHFFEAARREYAQRIRRLEGAGSNAMRVAALAGEVVVAATAPGAATAVVVTVTAGGAAEFYSRQTTLSIAISANATLQLAAGNDWGVIGYESSTLHITDASEILSLVIGTVFVSRRSGTLVLNSPNATVRLLGTRLLFEVPGQNQPTVQVYEGRVSIYIDPQAPDSLPAIFFPQPGGTLTAPPALQTVVAGLPAPATTAMAQAQVSDGDSELMLDCSSAAGRANQRLYNSGFEGCDGDALVSGLSDDQTVIVVTGGETVTLTGTDTSSSISVSASPGTTVKWAAYPFSPHQAVIGTGDTAVDFSYGVSVAMTAEVRIGQNSTVELLYAEGAEAVAAASRTLSMYVRSGAGVSGVGSNVGDLVSCLTDMRAVLMYHQLRVLGYCGNAITKSGSDSQQINGRKGATVMMTYTFDGGNEMFRFELSPAGPLSLINTTGMSVTLQLSSASAEEERSYELVAHPSEAPAALNIAPATLTLMTRIYDEFSADVPDAPVAFRTRQDGGAGNDEYPVLTVQFVALGAITHDRTDYPTFNGEATAAFDGNPGSFAVDLPADGAGEENKFVTIRIDEAFDDETAITVSLVAADDFAGTNVTVTAVITLQARHPGAVTADHHGYASPLLTANGFRVFKREYGNRIYTVGAVGNALAGGVSLSGLDAPAGGNYGFARTHNGPGDVPSEPAGWDDNDGDGVPYMLTLVAAGTSGGLPLAGEHTVEIAISDDHADSGDAVLTLSVRLENDITVTAVAGGSGTNPINFHVRYNEVGTLTVQLNGGGGDYDFSLGGSGSALGLVSTRGSVAVLTLSSAMTTTFSRDLTITPRGAWAAAFSPLTIPINAVVFSVFAGTAPSRVVFRTELDGFDAIRSVGTAVNLVTVQFSGNQGAISGYDAPAYADNSPSSDPDYAADHFLVIENTNDGSYIIRITAAIESSIDIYVTVVATDAGTDSGSGDDMEATVVVTLQARHPGAIRADPAPVNPVTMSNGVYFFPRVHDRPIITIGAPYHDHVKDMADVTLSGLDAGESYEYQRGGYVTASGWVDNITHLNGLSSPAPFSLNLAGTGDLPEAGQYNITIQIMDQHAQSPNLDAGGPGGIKYTVNLVDEIAVGSESAARVMDNTVAFFARTSGPATLTLTLSGGGDNYDFNLRGSGDALKLGSDGGSLVVLTLSSTVTDSLTRELVISPRAPWATIFAPLHLTISAQISDRFTGMVPTIKPIVLTELDSSKVDSYKALLTVEFSPAIGQIMHISPEAILYTRNGENVSGQVRSNFDYRGAIPDSRFVTIGLSTIPIEEADDIVIGIVAWDDSDSMSATITVTVQARHANSLTAMVTPAGSAIENSEGYYGFQNGDLSPLFMLSGIDNVGANRNLDSDRFSVRLAADTPAHYLIENEVNAGGATLITGGDVSGLLDGSKHKITIIVDDNHGGNGDLRFTLSAVFGQQIELTDPSPANNTVSVISQVGVQKRQVLTFTGGGSGSGQQLSLDLSSDANCGDGKALQLDTSGGETALVLESGETTSFTCDLTVKPSDSALAATLSALSLTISAKVEEKFVGVEPTVMPVVRTELDKEKAVLTVEFSRTSGQIEYDVGQISYDPSGRSSNFKILPVNGSHSVIISLSAMSIAVAGSITIRIPATDSGNNNKATVTAVIIAEDPGAVMIDSNEKLNALEIADVPDSLKPNISYHFIDPNKRLVRSFMVSNEGILSGLMENHSYSTPLTGPSAENFEISFLGVGDARRYRVSPKAGFTLSHTSEYILTITFSDHHSGTDDAIYAFTLRYVEEIKLVTSDPSLDSNGRVPISGGVGAGATLEFMGAGGDFGIENWSCATGRTPFVGFSQTGVTVAISLLIEQTEPTHCELRASPQADKFGSFLTYVTLTITPSGASGSASGNALAEPDATESQSDRDKTTWTELPANVMGDIGADAVYSYDATKGAADGIDDDFSLDADNDLHRIITYLTDRDIGRGSWRHLAPSAAAALTDSDVSDDSKIDWAAAVHAAAPTALLYDLRFPDTVPNDLITIPMDGEGDYELNQSDFSARKVGMLIGNFRGNGEDLTVPADPAETSS